MSARRRPRSPHQYTVTDGEAASQTLTVTETVTNGSETITLRTYTATSGTQNTADLSDVWLRPSDRVPRPENLRHRRSRRKRDPADHVQPYRHPDRRVPRDRHGREGRKGLPVPVPGGSPGRRDPSRRGHEQPVRRQPLPGKTSQARSGSSSTPSRIPPLQRASAWPIASI